MMKKGRSSKCNSSPYPVKDTSIRRQVVAMTMVLGLSVMVLNILERLKEAIPGNKGATGGLVITPPPPPPPPSSGTPGGLTTELESSPIEPLPEPKEPPNQGG